MTYPLAPPRPPQMPSGLHRGPNRGDSRLNVVLKGGTCPRRSCPIALSSTLFDADGSGLPLRRPPSSWGGLSSSTGPVPRGISRPQHSTAPDDELERYVRNGSAIPEDDKCAKCCSKAVGRTSGDGLPFRWRGIRRELGRSGCPYDSQRHRSLSGSSPGWVMIPDWACSWHRANKM